MSTVTPLAPIPTLGSYTSRQSSGRGGTQSQQALGEIFKATVLEARPGDRYLLDIANNRLLASSEARLTPGQQLQLQVVSTSPQVELKIVSEVFSALSGRSLVLLGTSLDLSALFASLTQGNPSPLSQLSTASGTTLASFLPDSLLAIINSREGGEFLRNLFNRLGLNLESLLARGGQERAPLTLKAALLEIAHRFQHSERLTEQVGKLLATLELYQLAQLQLGQDRFLLFPLPIPFLDQGYVIVEKDHGEQDENGDTTTADEHHFSLHLSLTGLGHVKVLMLLNPEGLHLRFFLDSQEKAAFAADFTGQLEQALSAAPLVSVSFAAGAVDPAGELVRRLIPKEQSILDTTA